MTLPDIPFVRPEMARPAPYRWQDNVPPGPVSRFDMNTLPLSPAAWPEIAAQVARLPSSSYPEATYRPLREAIGRFTGFDWTQVVPGAGCDELLLMCGALAMGRGDHAVVCKPTYQMYAVASATGNLVVTPATPTVTWANPAGIVTGTSIVRRIAPISSTRFRTRSPHRAQPAAWRAASGVASPSASAWM